MSPKISAHILVLGLGNILLQDEGVGVHIVRKLENDYRFDPHIDIVDGGTMGMDLIPYFDHRKRVIIIDVVNFGKMPGYVQKLNDHEILTTINTKLSEHQSGLRDVLSTLKLMEIEPDKIILFGIQPKSVDMGLKSSSDLQPAIEKVLTLILNTLNNWGVNYQLKHNN